MKGSNFVFSYVQLLHCKCHKINLNCGGSYIAPGEKLFTRQIFVIFPNFWQVREIKSFDKKLFYFIYLFIFFFLSELAKLNIFTLVSLSINNGHVKYIL